MLFRSRVEHLSTKYAPKLQDITFDVKKGEIFGLYGLVALTGKHHGESEEAQKLGVKIVTYMRDRADQFSDQYHHNYSVLATPAEGLSGKFTGADRKKFGVLPGITDRDYYTNSNHVPVYYKCSARHKAEVEAPYHRSEEHTSELQSPS